MNNPNYDDVLKFWFGEDLTLLDTENYRHKFELWFKVKWETDELIKSKFGDLLAHIDSENDAIYAEWSKETKSCVALILVLSQFTRNVHRGTVEMFKNDVKATALANNLISQEEKLKTLSHIEKYFVYLSLVHVEEVDTAKRGLDLIEGLAKTAPEKQKGQFIKYYQFAKVQCGVLIKFGRYPHRNFHFNRETTGEELEFLERGKHNFVKSVMPLQRPSLSIKTSFEIGLPNKKPVVQMTTANTARGAKLPRQKILFLHGFRQNANKAKKRLGRLINALKNESNAHVTFLNGTHPYKPSGVNNSDNELNPIESQRVWFYVNEDASEYAKIDESISHVVTYVAMHGPFDGIVGFSQGSALASVIVRKFPNLFKYVILISGFKPRSNQLEDLYSYSNPYEFASFHTYGVNDTFTAPDRSVDFAKCFISPVVVSHGAGHFAPDAWPANQICEFVTKQGEKNQSPTIFKPAQSLASKIQQLDNQLVRFDLNQLNLEPLLSSTASQDLLKSHDFRTFIQTDAEVALDNLAKLLKSVEIKENSATLNDVLFVIYSLMIEANDYEDRNRHKIDFTSLPLEKLHSYVPAELFLFVYLDNLRAFKEYFLEKVINELFVDTNNWKQLIYLCNMCYMVSKSQKTNQFDDSHRQESESLYTFIIQLFSKQLFKDLKRLDAENKSNLVQELTSYSDKSEFKADFDYTHDNGNELLSELAKNLPRIRSSIDKRSRIARECAQLLNPYVNVAETPEKQETAKIVSYNHYRKCLTAICFYNDKKVKSFEMDTNPRSQMYAARYDKAAMEKLAMAPFSDAIINPVPEPVDVSSHEQMRPLYEWLEQNRSSKFNETDLQFLKGTVTGDGRLDLCKQVIGPHGVKPLLDAMQSNSQIDRILLGNNIVGDDSGKLIADFIKSGKSKIVIWYIAGNNLTAKGIAPITDALLNDTQVKALWLKRNPLKADGMVPIGNLLRFNSTIQVLDLLNCGLLDSGVAVLFEAMKENKGLRHLYLSANGITPAGLESIKSFYSTGKSQLQTLFLGCNRICNEGAKIIADCLNYDKELLTLNLPSSRIGAEGMKHLAEALIKHDRIRVLELGYMRATLDLGELGNFIEDEGAEHLARYIEKSKNLLSLSITHNHITEKGMAAIKRAVKVNESLVSLDYVQYGVPVSEVVLEDLKRTLDNNRKQYELKKVDIESILIPEHVREIYSVYRTH